MNEYRHYATALRARPLLLRRVSNGNGGQQPQPQPRRDLIGSNPFNSGNEFQWTILIRACHVRRAGLPLFLSLTFSFSPVRSLLPSSAFVKLQLKSASATPPRYRAGFYIRRYLMISRELESHTQTAGAIHVHYNLEGEVSPLKELRTRSSQVDGNWLIFKKNRKKIDQGRLE